METTTEPTNGVTMEIDNQDAPFLNEVRFTVPIDEHETLVIIVTKEGVILDRIYWDELSGTRARTFDELAAELTKVDEDLDIERSRRL